MFVTELWSIVMRVLLTEVAAREIVGIPHVVLVSMAIIVTILALVHAIHRMGIFIIVSNTTRAVAAIPSTTMSTARIITVHQIKNLASLVTISCKISVIELQEMTRIEMGVEVNVTVVSVDIAIVESDIFIVVGIGVDTITALR